MKTSIRAQCRPALTLLAIFTLICGVIYPALVAGIGHVAFKEQAEGSVLRNAEGEVLGSTLIGQAFTAPNYFWSRPSYTEPFPYNAAASASSQLAPGNEKLHQDIETRVKRVIQSDPEHRSNIPADLVTASASGLDPHISRASAYYQIPRVAKARRISEEELRTLVDNNTERREWFVFGEPRVRVLELNLALDKK